MGEDLLSRCLLSMLSYCLNMLQVIRTSCSLWVAVLSVGPFGLLCMQALTASSVQVMEWLMNLHSLSRVSSGYKACTQKPEAVVCCFQGFNMAVRNASMQLPDSAVKLDQLIQQRVNGTLKVSSIKLLSCATFALPNGC